MPSDMPKAWFVALASLSKAGLRYPIPNIGLDVSPAKALGRVSV